MSLSRWPKEKLTVIRQDWLMGIVGANSSSRRQDIQVIRAVAVIAVILFHAELPFKGGFLGVDIFFVLSGFVVTQLLARRIANEKAFSLRDFYAQRARRLLPALFLVIAVTTPIVLLVFPRIDEASAGLITGGAGLFSLANIAAAIIEFDYFAAPSKENFMLHLWSLSLEEQFYLLWPVAIVLGVIIFKKRKHLIVAMFALLFISFCIWVIGSTELLGLIERGQTFFGFYSPFSRAWEFVAGGVVALIRKPSITQLPSRWLRLASWLTILLVLIFASRSSSFFTVQVVMLVVATTFLLALGGSSPDARKLARNLRFFEWVGDRSYSLYLWHWPFSVFGAIVFSGSYWGSLVGTLVSFPLALIAFALVENPIHRRTGWGSIALPKLGVPLALSATMAAVLVVVIFPVVEKRVGIFALSGDLDEEEYYSYAQELGTECRLELACMQSRNSNIPDIVIIGNSHGAHLFVGLAEFFPNRNVVWIHDSSIIDGEIGLDRIIKQVPTPEYFVVGEYLSKPGNQKLEIPWAEAFHNLSLTGAQVLVTNGSPTLEYPAYKCKYGVFWDPSLHRCKFPSGGNNSRYEEYSVGLEAAAGLLEAVRVVDSYHLFCDSMTCRIGSDKAIYFRDLNHFGIEGSRLAASKIAEYVDTDPLQPKR